jgi:hypothetical protein
MIGRAAAPVPVRAPALLKIGVFHVCPIFCCHSP